MLTFPSFHYNNAAYLIPNKAYSFSSVVSTTLPIAQVHHQEERNRMEKENNMATDISSAGKKTACVTGAAGYMASALVKKLLEEGYSVNATVRDPENQGKVSHLLNLPGSDRLKLFRGDLTVEGSFDEAVSDCDIVFHVATPVHFESKEPENDMIKPAIQGSVNVLRSCARVKSVKRVILTSSAAAVSINQRRENGQVMTEDDWTDVEYLTSEKPPTWGYPVSKTLAEKAAWKFAEENKIDLITILPVLMSGPSLTQEIPSSVCLALALLTGNEFLIEGLKHMQLLSGSISLVHVHDICRAQIFLAEKESASGRYICCPINTSVPELANFLADRYPQYKVPTEFGDFPAKPKLSICSQKLMKEGFSFKYGIEEMYDDSVEYLKAKGLLPK